jgi:hypothetical protein
MLGAISRILGIKRGANISSLISAATILMVGVLLVSGCGKQRRIHVQIDPEYNTEIYSSSIGVGDQVLVTTLLSETYEGRVKHLDENGMKLEIRLGAGVNRKPDVLNFMWAEIAKIEMREKNSGAMEGLVFLGGFTVSSMIILGAFIAAISNAFGGPS